MKLKHLDRWTSQRRSLAKVYSERLGNIAGLRVPQERKDSEHAYHLYVVRMPARDALAQRLGERGIGTLVHYPLTARDQPCYLEPSQSFLSMTKRSMYIDKDNPKHVEDRLHIVPGKSDYLFVYPFVKTREWYSRTPDQRQEMMDEHIRIGTKYRSVKLHTTYSFGLDDQEFVVAFETDNPADFLDLVQELRETKASSYTLRDTPMFTCRQRTLAECLEALG